MGELLTASCFCSLPSPQVGNSALGGGRRGMVTGVRGTALVTSVVVVQINASRQPLSRVITLGPGERKRGDPPRVSRGSARTKNTSAVATTGQHRLLRVEFYTGNYGPKFGFSGHRASSDWKENEKRPLGLKSGLLLLSLSLSLHLHFLFFFGLRCVIFCYKANISRELSKSRGIF